MQNPSTETNQKNLRNLSEFLYTVSHVYRRLVLNKANQFDAKSYIVYPKLNDNGEVEETSYADAGDATKWAAKAKNIDDAQGWLVGAEYNIPQSKNWTVKAQYSQNDTSFKDNSADFKAKQVIAGADYAFSKQVKTYGYAGYLTLEQADKKDKQPVGGLGLEFKF